MKHNHPKDITHYLGRRHTFEEPCYTKHKPMPLVIEGKECVIYGGSCWTPIVGDADVYVGFDQGQTLVPFNSSKHIPEQINYNIYDMSVPDDVDTFKDLLHTIAQRLKDGKKVHAGCIGGHGRTGLFFAALVATYMNVECPIAYVRSNYCNHAVETSEQEYWLSEVFNFPKPHYKHQSKLSHKIPLSMDTEHPAKPLPQHLMIL